MGIEILAGIEVEADLLQGDRVRGIECHGVAADEGAADLGRRRVDAALEPAGRDQRVARGLRARIAGRAHDLAAHGQGLPGRGIGQLEEDARGRDTRISRRAIGRGRELGHGPRTAADVSEREVAGDRAVIVEERHAQAGIDVREVERRRDSWAHTKRSDGGRW